MLTRAIIGKHLVQLAGNSLRVFNVFVVDDDTGLQDAIDAVGSGYTIVLNLGDIPATAMPPAHVAIARAVSTIVDSDRPAYERAYDEPPVLKRRVNSWGQVLNEDGTVAPREFQVMASAAPSVSPRGTATPPRERPAFPIGAFDIDLEG